MKKSLAAAASKSIRIVILIGEEEASIGKVRIKDMAEASELVVSIEEAITLIKGELQ